MTLDSWGWDPHWAAQAGELGLSVGSLGRVVEQDRDRWAIEMANDSIVGRLVSTARLELYPVVGDWVSVEPGPMPVDPWSIRAVLPRRSRFSRATAGGGATEQVLAANVDLVWIVHGLDAPLNPRRLERYLAVAWESGALPEVVLTKADLTDRIEPVLAEVQAIAVGVSIRSASATDPASVQSLGLTLEAGRTVALLGPSGVGKSTLINLLAGTEVARTGAVRAADRKGRHTTTRRELFRLDSGALMLDAPGLRELRVWELDQGLDQAFPEIHELAERCRFRDCRHESEPGCGILEAVSDGRIDSARLASFQKLRKEAEFQARKTDPLARAAYDAQHKSAMKTLKYHQKYQDRS